MKATVPAVEKDRVEAAPPEVKSEVKSEVKPWYQRIPLLSKFFNWLSNGIKSIFKRLWPEKSKVQAPEGNDAAVASVEEAGAKPEVSAQPSVELAPPATVVQLKPSTSTVSATPPVVTPSAVIFQLKPEPQPQKSSSPTNATVQTPNDSKKEKTSLGKKLKNMFSSKKGKEDKKKAETAKKLRV
jgi:hypothetical protein